MQTLPAGGASATCCTHATSKREAGYKRLVVVSLLPRPEQQGTKHDQGDNENDEPLGNHSYGSVGTRRVSSSNQFRTRMISDWPSASVVTPLPSLTMSSCWPSGDTSQEREKPRS